VLLAAGALIAACNKAPSGTPADSAAAAATPPGAATTPPVNAGTSAAPAAATGTPAGAVSGTGPVAPAIDAIGNHGEDSYDMITGRKWAVARAKLDSIRTVLPQVSDTLRVGDASRAALATATSDALAAVAARNVAAGATAANRITYLAAQLAEPYHPVVPADVALLDYYGRELVLGAQANDMARLTGTRDAITRVWNEVRPTIEAHNGAAVARRFGAIVTRIASAKTAAEYRQQATPMLDEVDHLENVFTKP